ncbi:hypothetical protein J40TS1_06460 [Paenibacillus montaniterrae]|uniref:WYL domain-containing protein n=1 Tax=Paenibacillus montaniterrae TaxID=429341 RepID=A0A919YMS5_9BACL|nr:hypothetical protein [Paenibacillus montaniterrae]GIP15004.1 hypothetical protein J40TS1_06460 [Paenibacillus montaniterrae]
MQKYIGKDVQLIYVDRKGNVSIRNVRVLVTGDQRFLAYCYEAKAVRTFNRSGVVDIELVSSKPLHGSALSSYSNSV